MASVENGDAETAQRMVDEAAKEHFGTTYDIRIRVGGKDYSAEVATAIKPSTKEIFYDIVNLVPIKIEDTPASSKALVDKAMEKKGGNASSMVDYTKGAADVNISAKSSLPNTSARTLEAMDTDCIRHKKRRIPYHRYYAKCDWRYTRGFLRA